MPTPNLTQFAAQVRAILVDEDGIWREDLSGADVIQDLTIVLEMAGLGGKDPMPEPGSQP